MAAENNIEYRIVPGVKRSLAFWPAEEFGKSKDNPDLSIRLTIAEEIILKTLLNNKGKIIDRKLLRDLLNKSDEDCSRAVDMHISRLRKKLNRSSAAESPIRTVFGYGWTIDL